MGCRAWVLAKVGCEVVYQPPRPQSPTSPIFKTDASFVTEPRQHDTALHNQEGTSSPSEFYSAHLYRLAKCQVHLVVITVYLGLSAARYVRTRVSIRLTTSDPSPPDHQAQLPSDLSASCWPNLGNPPMPGACTALQGNGAANLQAMQPRSHLWKPWFVPSQAAHACPGTQ